MTAVRGALERLMNRIWYGGYWLAWPLLPFSLLVRWEISRRRRRAPAKGATPEGVLVIVVGGITVGGTGKTPVLMALGQWLQQQGYRVGVVSRGYRGACGRGPHWVTPTDSAAWTGDEPLMIQRALSVPVVVGRDRAAALALLIERCQPDVVLSDDGLQHYAMPRDIEIAVLDHERGLGNGWLLPAGPLREPALKLGSVDWVLERNSDDVDRGFVYHVRGVRNLISEQVLSWSDCRATWAKRKLTAITGLGQPEQFFAMLAEQGFSVEGRALPDHEPLAQHDLDDIESEIVLITAKDAAKLSDVTASAAWARVWIVEIEARLPPALLTMLKTQLPQPASD